LEITDTLELPRHLNPFARHSALNIVNLVTGVFGGSIGNNNNTFWDSPHTGVNTGPGSIITGLDGVVYKSGPRVNSMLDARVNYLDPLFIPTNTRESNLLTQTIPPTDEMFWGHHVITGGVNFDQQGDNLIAGIGRSTLYIDNKLVSDLPHNAPKMIFPGLGILQMGIGSGGVCPVYAKHIRMYEGVIQKSMLDALPTAHPN